MHANNYINNFRIVRPGRKQVVIIYTHNNASNFVIKYIISRISHECTVIVFGQKFLLSTDFKNTVINSHSFYEDSTKTIKDYLSLNDTEAIEIIGASIGSVFACRLTKELRNDHRLNSLTLVCPPNSLSDLLFKSNRTRYYRRNYLNQGYSYRKCSQQLIEFDAVSNLDNFQPQNLSIVYSKSDKIVPPNLTDILIQSLNTKTNKKIYRFRFTGHALTMLIFWLRWTTRKFSNLKIDKHLIIGQ